MKKTKSSSGDLSSVNKYMHIHKGHEVTTWKIIRTRNKVETKPYQKVL